MYKSNLTNAIAEYNRNNPTLRKLTLTSIAKQIGCSQPYLSGIGKSKEFEEVFSFVFRDKFKHSQISRWEYCFVSPKETTMLQRLEAIRKILGCEIYDLINRG